MNPEMFKKTLDQITEKVGAETAAIIADDLGTLKTLQNEALDHQKERESKIEELTTTNQQLVASNANLLQKIPVNEENQLVPRSQPQLEQSAPPVDPFDEWGRLKK